MKVPLPPTLLARARAGGMQRTSRVGGTVYLPRLMRRARALDVILGAELFGADMGERCGCVNRALPADELDDSVSTLARNIAHQAPDGVSAAKLGGKLMPYFSTSALRRRISPTRHPLLVGTLSSSP